MTVPEWFQMLQAVNPVVTWCLVVAGWAVVRHDNNKRENRKELRGKLDVLINDVRLLEEKAHDYYMKDSTHEDIPLLTLDIKRRQQSIEKRLAMLKKTNEGFQGTDESTALAKTVTGGNFEERTRKKIAADNRKLLEISGAALEFIEYLESEFETQKKL